MLEVRCRSLGSMQEVRCRRVKKGALWESHACHSLGIQDFFLETQELSLVNEPLFKELSKFN